MDLITITVGGWVRSVRDSKTFGFIVVNDGTFFEPLQIVYHDKMDNFAEVSRTNVGAAVIVTGTLVATPQAKQPFEIQADTVEVEAAQLRISEDDLTSQAQDEHLPGSIPGSVPGGLCIPQILPGEGLHLCAYAADHRQRL